MGNPLSIGDNLYKWEGRELVRIEISGKTIDYRYNDSGFRTYKKITINSQKYDEYFYYLEGDKVIEEKIVHYNNGNSVTNKIYYRYDANGTLIGMNNGNEYFYMRNLQQDIVALLDSSGNIIVEYRYDGWGNITYQTDND